MKKLSNAQAKTLRTIAAAGGTMDGYGGQKGFYSASLEPLTKAGLLTKLGDKKAADGTYEWYCRHTITEAGLHWIAENQV